MKTYLITGGAGFIGSTLSERLIKEGNKVIAIDNLCNFYNPKISEVLAFYRVGIKSLSSNKFKAVLGSWKVYLKEEMSWIKRIYCFVCYIVNATLRRA